MAKMLKQIVVVGGGTAGWLSASILAATFRKNGEKDISIKLIESPDVPTIGVGEGTVPTMRQTLNLIGVSETDFIRECNVTFKQSIQFVDWMKTCNVSEPHSYYHLFQYPISTSKQATELWLQGKGEIPFANFVSPQLVACELGLAPKKITNKEYQGIFDYAYHLDAGLFSGFLAKHGTSNLGIEHIEATVESVALDSQGGISNLELNTGQSVEGDLFIDCSGFRSLLLGQALSVGFESKRDVLFVDKAITAQVPYSKKERSIASNTIATAHSNGWIWDIGLTERRGVGFVYSSKYCSDEQAKQGILEYLGTESKGVTFRQLSMEIGYREKFWHKNCVAIGLSAGFLEPLEATAILLIEATAKLVAEQLPRNHAGMESAADSINNITKYAWDRVIDFIKLHYCISDREDSQFWLDNRDKSTIPKTLQDKLKTWRYRPPTSSDFFSKYDVFHLENYLYVLYGMNFSTEVLPSEQAAEANKSYEYFKLQNMKSQESVIKKLPLHRPLIESVQQFGFQKI